MKHPLARSAGAGTAETPGYSGIGPRLADRGDGRLAGRFRSTSKRIRRVYQLL